MKFSEKYRAQVARATFGTDNLGRLKVDYTEDGGSESWECIPLKGKTLGQAVDAWVDSMRKKIESFEIRESFEGLSVAEVMAHPSYSHSRLRSYGVTFYARNPHSPTGVCAVGGCSFNAFRHFEINAKKVCK